MNYSIANVVTSSAVLILILCVLGTEQTFFFRKRTTTTPAPTYNVVQRTGPVPHKGHWWQLRYKPKPTQSPTFAPNQVTVTVPLMNEKINFKSPVRNTSGEPHKRYQLQYAPVPAVAVATRQEHERQQPVVTVHKNWCHHMYDDCVEFYEPIELDKNHFPNLLPAVQCQETPGCQKVVYPFRVLKKRTGAEPDEAAGGCGGGSNSWPLDHVPAELCQQNWVSYEQKVTIACYCHING